MPFIPKSQYSIKHTNGGELYNPQTGTQYKGEYIQYKNKYFAGNTILDLSTTLKLIEIPEGNMAISKETFLYNQLNKTYYNKVKNLVAPFPSKPAPTKDDYEKGVFKRYFCQRANNLNFIIEINKETYDNSNISSTLYLKGSINWSLQSKENNNTSVLKLMRKYPNINYLFSNPEEFIGENVIQRSTPNLTQQPPSNSSSTNSGGY